MTVGSPTTSSLVPGQAAVWTAAVWLFLVTPALAIAGARAGASYAALPVGIAAAGYGLHGLRLRSRALALPASAAFDGQVIARWGVGDSDGTSYFVTVDDGARAWTFEEARAYHRTAVGDLVRVACKPRTRTLTDLIVTASQRNQQPRPPALLTAAEAAAVTGPPTKGGDLAGPTWFWGTLGSLQLDVLEGESAAGSIRRARHRGVPLPEVGDGAWQLGRGRVVLVEAGDRAVRLRASRARQRQNLPALAGLVARRIR